MKLRKKPRVYSVTSPQYRTRSIWQGLKAESSSQKCGTHEIALFAALWNRLLRTIDYVKKKSLPKNGSVIVDFF
jgi:hypothetical protein